MNLLRDLAARLVAVDTVSSRGNAALMAELADRLESAGFRAQLQSWGEGADAKGARGSEGPHTP